MRRGRWVGAGLLLAGLIVLGLGGRPLLLSGLTSIIRLQFPAVRWISPAALRRWQAESTSPAPLLLDVRTAPEFTISHLPGARRIEPGAPLPPDLLALPRTTPIVTYCAVSYRSAIAAQLLVTAGFTRVQNLDGSIFRWANEGYPLVAEGGPMSEVHGYGSPWRFLLDPDRRAVR
jgi:rhodanese-related sulfurtransferase